MTDTNFNLSRRKTLAALGTIGAASAGAGLGTSAFFSDQETFENNQLTAGELDLKVGWQEHYSNWMDDDYGEFPGAETKFARMPDDDEEPDLFLPPGDDQSDAQPIELLFVDEAGDDDDGFDSRPGEADGGRQFLRNTQRSDVNGGIYGGPDTLCDTESDADGRAVIEVDDVKPGDFGAGLFRLQLCDNPGYLWLTGDVVDARENGVTEPEADDPDEEAGVVELLDEIQVAYSTGTTNDIAAGAAENPLPLPENGSLENQRTLREFLAQLQSGSGIELEGDLDAEAGGGTGSQGCFAGESNHYASVVWWLPIDHGNQVQSDSVTFNLGFYTEQCRHNDGSGMAEAIDLSTGSADWQVVSSPDGTTGPAVVTDPHPAWATTDCASWIDPYGNDPTVTDPVGEYTYEVEFTIEGSSTVDTLVIDTYGSDNPVEFFLDGTAIGGSGGDSAFSSLRSDIAPIEDLDSGSHTLRAVVENASGSTGNPTGLLVCAHVE